MLYAQALGYCESYTIHSSRLDRVFKDTFGWVRVYANGQPKYQVVFDNERNSFPTAHGELIRDGNLLIIQGERFSYTFRLVTPLYYD